MEEKIIFNTEDVKQNKVFGILSYIGILVLVPIFAARDSQYAKFHANQGLVFFIFCIALNVIARVITISISFLPFVGTAMGILLSAAVGIIALVFMIIGILNACSGDAKKLPIIGNITILK